MQVDSSGLEQGSASTAGVALPSRVWLIALAPAVLTSVLLAALAVCTHYCYKSTSSEQRKGLLAHGSLSGDGSSCKSSGGSGGGAGAGGAGGGFCGVLRLRSARMLLLCCFAFMISFNSFMFLAAWVVQHITGSAWLVQVSGFFFMAPMLLGPFLGKVADRCDKRAMEAVVLGAVTVSSCLITAAMHWVETGVVSPEVVDHRGSARSLWLGAIYAHATVVGIGMPAFQCTHLPRIKAAVGEEAATAANAAAMSCFGAGGLIGSQLGGLIVEHLGVAGGYAVASGWTLLAFLLLFTAPSEEIIHVAGRATASRSHSNQAALPPQPYQPQMQDVLAAAESDVQPATSTTLDDRSPPPSIWMLLRNRAYFGVLGVTVLANLLFWGHIPFVQVLAARLGSTPSQVSTTIQFENCKRNKASDRNFCVCIPVHMTGWPTLLGDGRWQPVRLRLRSCAEPEAHRACVRPRHGQRFCDAGDRCG